MRRIDEGESVEIRCGRKYIKLVACQIQFLDYFLSFSTKKMRVSNNGCEIFAWSMCAVKGMEIYDE